jgi:hypothetical protein
MFFAYILKGYRRRARAKERKRERERWLEAKRNVLEQK